MFVVEWLRADGFAATLQALTGDRHNVVAILEGMRDENKLLGNRHLDSEQGLPDRHVTSMDDLRSQPRAWVEGNRVLGKPVHNDRGPMAATMIAAKASKQSHVKLKGDLILSLVAGEIGQEQVNEFQGSRYLGKGIGSRPLVAHGSLADSALVAETTDFGVTWIEAGAPYVKISRVDGSVYKPRSHRCEQITEHPDAIVKWRFLFRT